MRLVALGTGAAFSTNYGNSQIYIDTGDPESSLLFDCGRTTLENLGRVGMPLSDIRNIYISHTHSDHIGGLADLALMCYFHPDLKKPNLIAKKSITKVLWNSYLAIMLETLAHGQTAKDKMRASFDDYFTVYPVNDNATFNIGDIVYTPVQTLHVVNGTEFMDSYGLFFEAAGKKVFLPGDTQFAPKQMEFLYKEADIIVHDCETTEFKSNVHAHLEDLTTLDPEIKAKMYLIHYNYQELTKEILDDISEAGFAGILEPGDTIEFGESYDTD